ncbi:uncharacterized protein LOC120292538 [Eucalyptus grandis]|uniref:uncharacterized protein LOC120292538 n=1 Tax=Eucalyptus grandis TaxID=71139 RepID=UPI00192EF8DF|nr:uncharacterized protein LOC120292538 [Eucalyptus grandis]
MILLPLDPQVNDAPEVGMPIRIVGVDTFGYLGSAEPQRYPGSVRMPGGISPHIAPRSFMGVEDYLDDDNSRPYYYHKGKKSRTPNKHVSFKQRTMAYMEPFVLDVFISKRFISTSLAPRIACKQVAIVGANSKDIKAVVKSRSDIQPCRAVGWILAD